MNELLLHDGGLLFVDGGLTTDPNCCCYYEPPECPPCCVRIDWGTFDSQGDLTATFPSGEFNEIAIKITMPTPNSRIVCDTEHIIIRWELSGPGDPDMTGGRLRHGACWHHVDNTPVETDNGKIYEYGLTDFGFDSESPFYEVELKFHSCFLDASGAFLGYLIVETEFPTDFSEEIDVYRCPTSDYCCLPQIDCQDCCAEIGNPSAIWEGDLWIVRDDVDPEEGHFTTLIRIETSILGLVCEGGTIKLTIYYIPPYQGDGIEHDVHIDHEPSWSRRFFDPALGVGGELTDIKTDWGTTDATEFIIELENACTYDEGECDFLAFPGITITSSVWNTTGVEFTECDLEDCCNLCAKLSPTLQARVWGVDKGEFIACNPEMTFDEIMQCWTTDRSIPGMAGQIDCGCAVFNLQLCCFPMADGLANKFAMSILNSSCEFLIPNPQGPNSNSTCFPLVLQFGPFAIDDPTDTGCIPCPGLTGDIWIEITEV
jgi:hypothetical protein